MIVVDASAIAEALVGATPDPELLDGLAGDVAAPHLLDTEVLSVLRGLALSRKLTDDDAVRARSRHFAFTIQRYEVQPLADRVWALRHQLTAYDATYVALAEALRAPLYTCDHKLGMSGHRVIVRVFGRSG